TPSGGYFIDKPLPLGLSLNGSTGIISGTPQAVSPAAAYTITAYSGTQSVVSTVTLATVVNNRDLSALTVSGTTIGDSFDANNITYNAVTAANLDSLTITPTAAAAGSTITCNGITVTSGSAIQVPVITGANTIAVVVTSEFGTAKTYTLNIKRGVRVSLDYGPEQTFTVNKAITAITPAAANVLPWGYHNPRKKVRSDFLTGNYLTALTDSAGTTYVVWQNLHPDDLGMNYITVVPADGGATYRIGGPFHYISAAIMDKEGNLYIAIEGGEVYKIIPSTNTVTPLPFSITNPRLAALALDDNNRLYIGDAHNGLFILDQTTGITTKVDSTKSTNTIAIYDNYIFYNDFGEMYRSELNGNNKIDIKNQSSQQLISFFDPAGYYYGEKIFVRRLGKKQYALDPNHDQIIKGIIIVEDTFNLTLGSTFYDGTARIDNSASIDGKGRFLGGLAGGFIFLDVPSGGYFIDKRLPPGMDFDEDTGIISGTPTKSWPKTNYHITAYNERENAVSTFTLGVKNNLELSNLVTDAGSLTPTFNADSTSYSITVNSSSTSANITATLSDTTNRLAVNGVAATSGAATSVALNAGDNNIPVVVMTPDSTTKTYVVNIHRISNDYKLHNLTASTGVLSPAFDADVTGYTVDLPNGTNSAKLTPTADAFATIKVNNVITRTGFASQNLALNPGDNNVEVDVTAEDGTSRQIYTVNLRVATSSSVSLGGITLSAGTLNPAFSPLSTGYRVTVPIGTAAISVLPVLTDARSSATVNGTAATSAVSVPLSNGLNLITVNVLADDGTTTNTYTITVNRLVPAPAATAVAAQVYTKGIAIAPLSAGLSNVGTPGYFALADTLTKALPTPTGIAINKAGDLFVADVTAGSVYKLPVGGGAPAVILNGLNNPLGVATDAGGNVYAIGLGSTGINKVTPAGVITTIGNSLVYPTALAVDTAGNIFVIETINHALKKVTPAGVTTTLTNNLTYPYGLTLNPAGDIYVADNNAGTIVKFDAAGGNKTELITGLTNPTDVKLDAQGNIYVNQGGSNLLTRFDKNGANPVNLSTGYEGLFGVAVGTDGKLYTTDNAKQAVEKLTPSGGYYLSDPLPNGLLFDAATGIISGTPTTLAAAKDYTITAYNSGGGTAQTINIAVLPNVSLANLTISEGTFTPAFDSTVGAYTATVANTTTSVTLTPTLSDASATVKVKGTLVSNSSASAPLSLAIGDNIIPVEVTGADGSTTKTYTVTVNRPGATVADLALISIDPASSLIVASKTKTQIGYTTSVSPLAATVSVTATLKDPNSTMTINGVAATSGLASAPVALNNSGVTFITTVVTAQDGVTTKTYIIAVSRTGSNISDLSLVRLSPASVLTVQSDTKALAEYSTSVSFATEEVSIIPTSKDPNATIKVNGITVANGATSPAIRLNAGATLITTVVTAEDGTTARTYKITVNRTGASVADLAILSMDPGSNLIPDIKSKTLITYGTSVGTNVTTVRFTPTLKDPNATITVNGVPAVSGVLSAPVALNTSGPTLVNIVVTAQDGTTTKTYAVTVNRTGGNLADLSQISTDPAYPLTVVSNSKTLTEYSIAVGMSLNSIKVLPTARDANASITVNGVPVASGAASAPVALNGVSTVITTVVTSGDGLNSKTYTLTVNRTGASVADLALLSLNPATVLAVQNNTKTLVEYSASVSLSTASLRVVPTAKDPNATIRVNGIVVASGTASAAITLNPVTTVINTIVTAEDGVTTRTYRVTVTRVPAANADLAKVSLSAGTALQLQTNTPELVTYTTAVNAATASLTVKPTLKDANATMTLNGLALANAAVSAPIALNTGNNTISIVVTAEDGSTTKTYNIIVNRPGNNLAVGRSDAKMFAAKSTNSFAPDEDAIVVHQGVSPNGDGFNDILVIEGISSFTGNKLSIMNTNGTLVFEMKDYGKDGSHVFDGHTQNGTLLKPGTYYYLLEYQNGQIAKRRSGYIVLKF
ncbi:gliding motility-associated-like protein, partial [Mucilaginibacter phyllosphaerae]|nr:gliding motility-associated-like protein [Mucilaginibacter phyllosphaerae]